MNEAILEGGIGSVPIPVPPVSHQQRNCNSKLWIIFSMTPCFRGSVISAGLPLIRAIILLFLNDGISPTPVILSVIGLEDSLAQFGVEDVIEIHV